MLYRMWRKLKRAIRNWGHDPTRADRNAVIRRVVTAAAEETKDKASAPLGERIARTPTPPGVQAPVPEVEFSKDAVGQRAHEIWVRNGRPTGTAESDWVQAVAELRSERAGVR